MTSQQLAYQQLLESERHNRETEKLDQARILESQAKIAELAASTEQEAAKARLLGSQNVQTGSNTFWNTLSQIGNLLGNVLFRTPVKTASSMTGDVLQSADFINWLT